MQVTRNFFLAIIVDAFVDVKTECDEMQVTRNFFADIFSLPRSWHLHRKYELPARHALCRFLHEAWDAIDAAKEGRDDADGPPLLEPDRLLRHFGEHLKPGFCHLFCRVDRLSKTPVVEFAPKDGQDARQRLSSDLSDLLPKTPCKKVNVIPDLKPDAVLPNTVSD
mmetsp:Transcript_28420/g.64075  ORF Transcript_28420/g.64075 Transcript_28420/m.64075 type:complete len:166 (+) Transcript_28420:1-498(+)